MPYYIYRIHQGPTAIVKNLELVAQHDEYKQAKQQAKQLRIEQPTDDTSQIKVMFADNQLDAEEKLMESREQPILREWEK
jgi:hypothetical protein